MQYFYHQLIKIEYQFDLPLTIYNQQSQTFHQTMGYIEQLGKDKKFAKLIAEHGELTLKSRENICIYLCSSIMSQQLSIKVAAVIYQRFLNLFDGKEPSPQQILDTPASTLRSIGLSNSKCNYIHNVARFAIDPGMDRDKLSAMSDEEVIQYLVTIKGVGRWTVEMLLMSALGREDVFAVDDLGIQNAMIHLYKLDKTDKKKLKLAMIKRSKKWSPYRTYACLHLWKALPGIASEVSRLRTQQGKL
jgi:DNA-3-methyladenine glycosylase II